MATTNTRAVNGMCPACGGRTLTLAAGGDVVCTMVDCPNREAATQLLADGEVDHVVVVSPADCCIRHPLVERLNDDLFSCGLFAALHDLDGPPRRPGRYRVRPGPTGWATASWVEIP